MSQDKVAVTTEDVDAFIAECVWLQTLYGHFNSLYGLDNKDNNIKIELLEKTAEYFFHGLNSILISQIIFQVCKITDPALSPTKNGMSSNLTVNFFIENLIENEAVESLKIHAERMTLFGEKLRDARNRRISHSDRNAAIGKHVLGDVLKNEYVDFLKELQRFVNILHDLFYDGIFPLDANPFTDELIRALKQSTFFETIFEKPKMNAICDEVIEKSKFSDL